eukprot:TRINITY_DN7129_c0_g2_i1.p1 TRINITY_DN7129_c0_g2~~TRINITY_DN7129_c0_g2_i1.p1  ORF type:complete len:544 (+),score=97.56 TRINITY_DN7129_c0_g2_i1:42-1673(+)
MAVNCVTDCAERRGSRSRSRSRCRGKQAEHAENGSRILQEYEGWLRSRGVWWDSRVRIQPPAELSDSETKSHPGCHGWGIICAEPVAKGETLIRVPSSAAFAATADLGLPDAKCVNVLLKESDVAEEFYSFKEDVDCQLPLALALLIAREKPDLGSNGPWWPKIRPEVTPPKCPAAWCWGWPQAIAERLDTDGCPEMLKGTELEAPIRAKRKRITKEIHALKPLLTSLSMQQIGLAEYSAACAVVMSRIQPWWGGSFVPFVDQANHSWQAPHVEFRLRRGEVVGQALREIPVGEVWQSYGELSTADSLYRYGFACQAATASDVSATIVDVVTLSAELLTEGTAAESGCRQSDRLAFLIRLGLLEESPWDGLEGHFGVELGLARRGSGLRGLRTLLAAMALLVLSEQDWLAILDESGQKEGSGSGSGSGASAAAVAAVARTLGATGTLSAKALRNASWPSLLPSGIAWAPRAARAAAAAALRLRDARYAGTRSLAEDEAEYSRLAATAGPAVDDEETWQQQLGALRLRIIERRLLAAAVAELGC